MAHAGAMPPTTRLRGQKSIPSSVSARVRRVRCGAAASTTKEQLDLTLQYTAAASVLGTARKQNEDRWDLQTIEPAADGSICAFLGVYDGHGGIATSDWLSKNLFAFVNDQWDAGADGEVHVNKAFRDADCVLLSPGGFMGMGERGVGGSKCGATAAVAMLYKEKSGAVQLLAANAGDSRVLLVRNGAVEQLSTDHVPDDEDERLRIEATNPNPKRPMVRYVGETWRVGGLLALSRAFGDAYMKGSLQFEGVTAGSDGYASGFGVIAEPSVQTMELANDAEWVIVCSDGLVSEQRRGGGSGLVNEDIAQICKGKGAEDADALADELVRAAQDAGSTDDVTVLLLRVA